MEVSESQADPGSRVSEKGCWVPVVLISTVDINQDETGVGNTHLVRMQVSGPPRSQKSRIFGWHMPGKRREDLRAWPHPIRS